MQKRFIYFKLIDWILILNFLFQCLEIFERFKFSFEIKYSAEDNSWKQNRLVRENMNK